MVIPTVGRSREDLLAPFVGGRFAGFVPVSVDVFIEDDHIYADYAADRDAARFGARWAAFSRASVFPTLAAALDGGPGCGRTASSPISRRPRRGLAPRGPEGPARHRPSRARGDRRCGDAFAQRIDKAARLEYATGRFQGHDAKRPVARSSAQRSSSAERVTTMHIIRSSRRGRRRRSRPPVRSEFAPGDTLKVNEGHRRHAHASRLEGVHRPLGRRPQRGFIVRKISYGEGVERVFPVPLRRRSIRSRWVRRGKVRRAKLYYLRDRRGKSARIRKQDGAPRWRSRRSRRRVRRPAGGVARSPASLVLLFVAVALPRRLEPLRSPSFGDGRGRPGDRHADRHPPALARARRRRRRFRTMSAAASPSVDGRSSRRGRGRSPATCPDRQRHGGRKSRRPRRPPLLGRGERSPRPRSRVRRVNHPPQIARLFPPIRSNCGIFSAVISRRTFLRLSGRRRRRPACRPAFAVEPWMRLVVTPTAHAARLAGGAKLQVAVITDTHACEPFMPAGASTHRRRPMSRAGRRLPLGDYVAGRSASDRRRADPAWSPRPAGAPRRHAAILGNHDWWTDGEGSGTGSRTTASRFSRTRRCASGQGLPPSGSRPRRPDRRLRAGEYRGRDDLPGTLAGIPDDGTPVILLAHEPDIFTKVPDRVSLTLRPYPRPGVAPFVGGPIVVPLRPALRLWPCRRAAAAT